MSRRVDPVFPAEPVLPVGGRSDAEPIASNEEEAAAWFADLLASLQDDDAAEVDEADEGTGDTSLAPGPDGGRARVRRRPARRRPARRAEPAPPAPDVLRDGRALAAWLGEIDDEVLVERARSVLELGF